jgi:putative lipase involved disintegration of autophagic bodies
LVPVLWNKRFGRYDYARSLAVYGDVRRVYRRQIAWLTVASIAGMVLLFDAA